MIPGRTESARLLLSLDPPPWHLRHSRAVAEVAAWLARAASAAGVPLDRGLVEAAALLHDVDKLPPVRAAVGTLRHGEGSAAWLAERGYHELGPAVAAHPVTRFADGDWFDSWVQAATPEAILVSYADKRAGQRLEPMADRFASWEERYPPESGRRDAWSVETLAAVRRRAGELERRACELARATPAEVARLRWTGPALKAAR